MELDENNSAIEHDDYAVEIYSKKAVFWFFFLAGPMFGGVLLMLNLKAAGYKKAIYSVLTFTILFDVLTNLLLINIIRFYKIDILAYRENLLNYKSGSPVFDEKMFVFSMITLVIKIMGGLFLSQYLFKRYFPDNDYYPRSITTALLVTIMALFFLAVILSYVNFGGSMTLVI
jgi:hypothetical protein